MLKLCISMVEPIIKQPVKNLQDFNNKKVRQGFTLVEMVIVLFVISISSLYIIHDFSANHEKILARAAVELQTDIQFTRQTAISENKKCYLQFWDNAQGYSIYKIEYNGSVVLVKETALIDEVSLGYFNSNQHSNRRIIYTSTGTTASPSTIHLYCGGKKIVITVNLGAGRVSIQEILDL